MDKIEHTTDIAAPLATVREAITTTAGHRGWWTLDCEVGAHAGERARFRFARANTTREIRFHIDRIDDHGIAMTCDGADNNPEWPGTAVELRATPHEGGTRVTLAHTNWRACTGHYQDCVGAWRYFMDSLKSYAETGSGTPFVAEPKE